MTTPSIPTKEPERFYAGDTLKFKINLPDYPPATWTITYSLVSAAVLIQFSGSAYEGVHLVNVDEVTTAGYTPGTYNYIARVTNGTDVFTVRRGQMKILADFSDAAVDGRSHVKKTLDALELTIEGKASKDQLNYAINGRSLSRMSPSELIDWHTHYLALYQQEIADERVSRGQATGNKIKARF